MIPETDRSVEEVFSPKVSHTYELINHILTFGCDVLWRRKATRIAASYGGTEWADMCTGTGETAAYVARLAPEGTTVHAVDFSRAMMSEAMKKPEADRIDFVESDVKTLPFEDQSLDLITMSFATRNLNLSREMLTRTFAEYHRVLKPGGQPRNAVIRKLVHGFIGGFVKPIGGTVSGAKPAYAYLAHTIPRFYTADVLADILRDAGFSTVTYRHLLLGVAAIHESQKQS